VPKHPGYPFIPKSTTHIRAGDFWAIPLRRGGWYACGRVLCLLPSRTLLIMGLMDWCEPTVPTAESLRGRGVIHFGAGHATLSIAERGQPLLGNLQLEDGDHWQAVAAAWTANEVGSVTLGGDGLEGHAHAHFGRHFPEFPSPATERPVPLRGAWRGF
jgi:hypothetical protein